MNFRVGIGTDFHKLDSNSEKSLIIGGVKIDFDKGVLAHSDGDVLIHAVVDALLGACALGDIGELFPDNDPANKDKNSDFFLSETMKLLKEHRFSVVNIDCVVHLQQPKLKGYKPQIKENIARMLEIPITDVNVKAKTREKLDAVGKSEAVEAIVIVLVEKL